MGVDVGTRYFGTRCLQSERGGAGLGGCLVSVRLRWLLAEKRGQMGQPARVPRDEPGLPAVTCGEASLPGGAAPAFLGRGPGEERREEGVQP